MKVLKGKINEEGPFKEQQSRPELRHMINPAEEDLQQNIKKRKKIKIITRKHKQQKE